MPNYSGEKKKWREKDPKIEYGWNVLRLDGSGFKPLRVPNLDLENLKKYFGFVANSVLECFDKFSFISFAYFIDDEIYFLIHSKDVESNQNRYSKTLCKVLSYFTAVINGYILPDTLVSQKEISYGRLLYDGRIIKLREKEICDFFEEIIDHGKMFVGNICIGDGRPFLEMDMKAIEEKALEMKRSNIQEYSLLFGGAVDKEKNLYQLSWDNFIDYHNLIKQTLDELKNKKK